jgi:hypothetical protein
VRLSPHAGSLSRTGFAAAVVLLFAVTGRDPVLSLFTWLAQLGTLAVLVLMSLASCAVLAFFVRHRDLDRTVLRRVVCPPSAP